MAATVAEIVDFLKKVPMFRGLKEGQLKKLAERCRERRYTAGDVIVEQGKMGVGLFVVARGEADVLRVHGDGSTLKLDTVQRMDFFGELSLLDEMPRSASVVANGDVMCLALTKLDFLDVLEEDNAMAVQMLKTLAHRYRQVLIRM